MNSWRCVFIYLTVSCSGPSMIGQQMANGNYVDSKIENLEDGAIRATAYSGIQSNQKINYNWASSDLSGASININPGALSISSSLVIEPGSDLVSGDFFTGMTLAEDNEIEVASSALLVESESALNPVGSLIISIPLRSEVEVLESFALSELIYSVAFEVFDYDQNRYLKGIIPTSEIELKAGFIEFKSSFFGNFQIIKTKRKIKEKISIESDKRPNSQRNRKKTALTKLLKPVLSFDSSSRTLSATLSSENNTSLAKCRLHVDYDKKLPFSLAVVWDMQVETVTQAVAEDINSLFARLECIDKEDRRLISEWSEELLTPKVGGGNGSGIATSCAELPEDWILIPGNASYGTEDFCVMQYEAKCSKSSPQACSVASSSPLSSNEAEPWVSISQQDAKAECESLGDGYQLISNDQWMTIATDISNQANNWDGGVVGKNSLNHGNSNSAEALGVSNSEDACVGTSSLCTPRSAWDMNRRTHTLSNGELIWDMAGNVWEWTSLALDLSGTDTRPTGDAITAVEYSSISDWGTMVSDDFIPQAAIDGNWNTSAYGIGKYLEGTGQETGALVRGGHYGGNSAGKTNTGIFAASLNRNAGTVYGSVGFRCSYTLPSE